MKRLDEIFTVTYGVNLELCYLTIDDSEDAINYVSRTKSKNGVSARVSRMENVKPNPGKTIVLLFRWEALINQREFEKFPNHTTALWLVKT